MHAHKKCIDNDRAMVLKVQRKRLKITAGINAHGAKNDILNTQPPWDWITQVMWQNETVTEPY